MATRTILLDVGGTFVKCSDGREVPIDSAGGREEISASLRAALGGAGAAAVAIPGPFDYATGTFLMKHKFASVYGLKFSDLAGPGDYVFIHDVNCMLKGALRLPEAAGVSRVALITLGTGLGFSYSVDGVIQCSSGGGPAVPLYNRPFKDGTAEDYASKRGAMRAWTEVTGRAWPAGQTVKDIAGTPEGRAAFALMGGRLGEAAAPLLADLKIECLLLGGQIAKSFSLMEAELRAGLSAVEGLGFIGPLPNLDSATFDGLESLLPVR